jgi:hypothetical protein
VTDLAVVVATAGMFAVTYNMRVSNPITNDEQQARATDGLVHSVAASLYPKLAREKFALCDPEKPVLRCRSTAEPATCLLCIVHPHGT